MKNIKLIYPPGKLFQRGEDRCQSNIEISTATSIRACNDLGYVASMLKSAGYNVFLKDYQTENLTIEDLLNDLSNEKIDVVFISVTNPSIFLDIEVANQIKTKYPDIIIIFKGAIFSNPEEELLNQLDLQNIEYLIGTDAEFIINELIYSHFDDKNNLSKISGILYKQHGIWLKTIPQKIEYNLDSLPFPARDLMNNLLYVRPDTNEPMATINVSKGCYSNCIFCLAPKISGNKVKLRSPESIYEEILDCYKNHKIKNFFFQSDTFTYDKNWTIKLCGLIINSKLNDKINWVANSRTNPIDEETLLQMKKAGCWLVAFGFESGSEKSLKLMKKGVTLEQNILAARLAKKVGLQFYGFYMIGFPWENKKDIEQTKKLIFKNDADFIELHIATPFYNTELYNEASKENLIDSTILGKDYFSASIKGTKYIKIKEIEKFRKNTIIQYHLRLKYIIKKIIPSIFRPKVLLNYLVYGVRLFKNN